MKMKSLRQTLTIAIAAAGLIATAAPETISPDSLVVSHDYVGAGTVDKVGEERMNKGLVTNALDALNGQAAGVSITTSNREAMLNSVRVRGTTSLTGGNDPLVVIDGVTSNLSTLSTIFPADIESFTILKDASETAQYGSRGASGVIYVTTKKGRGGQFSISYDCTFGVDAVAKNVKMLNGAEYRATAVKLGQFIVDGGTDTNFLKAIERTGFVHNHHIAFGGGNENSTYRASIALMNHSMVVKSNDYANYSAKVDLQQKAFDKRLILNIGLYGAMQKNHEVYDVHKWFYSAAAMNPTFPTTMTPDGGWYKNPTASQINNPMSLIQEQEHISKANFNGHLDFDLNLGRGLHLFAFGSYSYNSADLSEFLPTWVAAQGKVIRGDDKHETLLGNLGLTYDNRWGKHSLNALAMTEGEISTRNGFYVTSKGFPTNDFGYYNLQGGSTRVWDDTQSYYEKPKLASFMARGNYSYADRYMLTLGVRADGSSMVGRNHRWGFFPSGSVAWVMSEESWLKDVDWLSRLRLNVGYGLSGNLGGLSSYNSLQLVKPNGVLSIDDTPYVTLGVARNANPDLRWEKRSTANVGVEASFLNSRIVATAEYYYSKTTDMLYLYDVPVPPYAYDKMLANIGSMSNSGFELGLGFTPIARKDMELNINCNLSYQRNKLITLSGYHQGEYFTAPDITPIEGKQVDGAGFHGSNNKIIYQIVGQPLGVFYLPHCTGIEKKPDGSYYYAIEDLDGNGVIEPERDRDRYIAGQATPKVTLGSNISFRYRNVDISLQINGAFGHKIYNATALSYMNMNSFPDYNVMRGAPEANIRDQEITDYWLERGDYVNFDYITVGYNIPLRGRAGSVIRNLRVSASVNNLATITSYSGLTPMINNSVVNETLGIDDKRSYPVYRTFSIGASIQF